MEEGSPVEIVCQSIERYARATARRKREEIGRQPASVKRFERSNGLATALYLYLF